MAIDAYLQIDGIKGESMDDKHKEWIDPWLAANRRVGARSAYRLYAVA
jgi:type VI protein secretion system component Hcp